MTEAGWNFLAGFVSCMVVFFVALRFNRDVRVLQTVVDQHKLDEQLELGAARARRWKETGSIAGLH